MFDGLLSMMIFIGMIKLMSLLPEEITNPKKPDLPVVKFLNPPMQTSYSKAASDGAGTQYQQYKGAFDGEAPSAQAKVGEETEHCRL